MLKHACIEIHVDNIRGVNADDNNNYDVVHYNCDDDYYNDDDYDDDVELKIK